MNDEPIIRLEPRRSRHGPNEDPRKFTGILRSMLRIVQMSKRGRQTGTAQSGAPSIRNYRAFNQRVAVRVSYAANKNPGQWKAHGRYVARDSATHSGRAAEAGFNRARNGIDIAGTLDNWQKSGDERLFKMIVSPEFGDRLNLPEYARELMRRMEQDLGVQLEWVGAVHHNTEHAHVHLAIRGVDTKGIPLRLPREYIRSGLRERAAEIATEILGYRSPADAHEILCREEAQTRYTSLDRILQRSNDCSSPHFVVTVNPDASLSESAQGLQRNLSARLMHLQKMGLAHFLGQQQWSVQSDFEKVLRTLQQSADRQKMLAAHGAILSDARLPLQITTLRQFQLLSGRILLHTEEEKTGRRYMLVEGTDAKVHLIYHTAAIEKARSEGKLAVNSFVRIATRFGGKKPPTLHVDDLGEADALLKNSSYFQKEAELLIRRGIRNAPSGWGGWLGQYHEKLQAELESPERGKRQSQGRGGRST